MLSLLAFLFLRHSVGGHLSDRKKKSKKERKQRRRERKEKPSTDRERFIKDPRLTWVLPSCIILYYFTKEVFSKNKIIIRILCNMFTTKLAIIFTSFFFRCKKASEFRVKDPVDKNNQEGRIE